MPSPSSAPTQGVKPGLGPGPGLAPGPGLRPGLRPDSGRHLVLVRHVRHAPPGMCLMPVLRSLCVVLRTDYFATAKAGASSEQDPAQVPPEARRA